MLIKPVFAALLGLMWRCVAWGTGGRGGIRTHGTLAGTPVFKTGALNHSATLPALESLSFSRLYIEQSTNAATALLPFSFSALVYGRAKHAVNRRSRAFLHIRHQVAVN